MKISEKLVDFIKKETYLHDINLSYNTVLETELGVTGDDADIFIVAFGKEFNVDVSNFEIGKYFKGEGIDLAGILNFLNRKKSEEVKQSVLTVGDLESAIIAGKLDETVIGHK